MHDERLYDEKELEKSWLISYSDLFTLLFVIILIVAAAHAAKLKVEMQEVKQEEAKQQENLQEVQESLDLLNIKKLELQRQVHELEARRSTLESLVDEKTGTEVLPKPAVPTEKGDDADRDMETVRTELSSALQELNIDYEETEEGLRVRLPAAILFRSGSADLQEEGKQVIGTVAKVLEHFSYRVRIEGYTDDMPIVHSVYRSNWELSSARAIAVMREMVDEHALAASRFTVAGWGEHKPLVDNSNAENRERNRRVEIVILAEKI
ncbi:OmpA family protein [Brevibacillus ruminantium]|uniref:OmpA family protein n=1 Tax=Brevibacillus ruminantium TaxID=2950604 RepID=A0ABY4WEZ0_9BACL|nr:OmpA family protein [Brevibacillus ruminantium]USG65309.1 OmpA family protein [Brevibacillus ruminantium]